MMVLPFDAVETILVDRRRIATLCRMHGLRDAESYLMERVGAIAQDLTHLQEVYHHGSAATMAKQAQALSDAASEIGLTTLARVARDVAICARSGDGVAFAAVWARLGRAGDHSIRQLWTASGLQM